MLQLTVVPRRSIIFTNHLHESWYVAMMQKIKKHLKNSDFWMDGASVLLLAALIAFLEIPRTLVIVIAVVFVIIGLVLFIPTVKRDSLRRGIHLSKMERKLRRTARKGSSVDIYKMIDTELLPEARRKMPENIYKYYPLGDAPDKNELKISTVLDNKIWASTYWGFNDPFECQYMFLGEDDLIEMGLPAESHKVWNDMMEDLRGRITTICFTQNPNNMPMWAHYANEHRGFCVEYKVQNTQSLYPVIYANSRLKTRAFFIDLIYAFFNPEVSTEERVTLLKHFIMLSAFKDKSWESENEIRAIFMNTKEELPSGSKGKLFSCTEIGVVPQKIYIGVKCSVENEKKLIGLAKELNIAYEKCEMSIAEEFSVIK